MRPPDEGVYERDLLVAELLDAPDSPALDRLARLVVRVVPAPIALVMVAGEGKAIVVGHAGLPEGAGRGVPAGSFGHRVLAHGESSDPNALPGTWEGETLGARAALGIPVNVGEGPVMGALVILDDRARVWTTDEIQAARELAAVVSMELDRRSVQSHSRRAERHQAVLERSPEAILVHVDGTIRFANAAAVSLLGGHQLADVTGRPIDTFFSPPYLKAVQEGLLQPEQQNQSPPLAEDVLHRLDGSTRYVELAALAYLRDDKPAVQMFLRDITERRVAREALRAREAQLRLLMERIPALYWTTDRSLHMEYWRPRGDPSAPGKSIGDFFGKPPDSVPVTTHQRALGGNGASDVMEWGGREYEVRVEPIWDEDGNVSGTVGVAVDTTVRRRAEAREREEREIDALGRVAGGVAHGVNNALATVVGVASVMAMDPSLTRDERRNLEAILGASARAQAIAANLLGFSRQGRYRTVPVDLNTVAKEAAEWTRNHDRTVGLDLADDLPAVKGDPVQLRQVLVNVCQNAVEATRQGERVRIVTRRARVEMHEGGDRPGESGIVACLEVGDAGAGMPAEVRARAVEPFFTTKGLGEGAGLGLSMAFGVMRSHGGDLHIKSAPGAGTAVTLCFPMADPEIALPATRAPARVAEAPPAGEPAGEPGSKAVLLVDDDEWVLYSSRQVVESLGYEAVEAIDGPTALTHFQQAGARFAFVLLDLRMPGMDGEEVLRRLLALDPEVRVIICTGYERDQVSQRIFATGHVGFLGKPFGVQELLEQVRELGVDAAVNEGVSR